MKIHWLLPGEYRSTDELLKSGVASVRMRAGLAASEAERRGITVSYGDKINDNVDIVVVGKIGGDCNSGRSELWIKQLKNQRENNNKIILDYTDNHAGNPNSSMGRFYISAFELIGYAVVPSSHMERILNDHLKIETKVITDPLEVPLSPPKTSILPTRPKLLWFGHSTNINYLLDFIDNEEHANIGLDIIILTNEYGLSLLSNYRTKHKTDINLFLGLWSINNMTKAAQQCQGCIIPSDRNGFRKSGASENRLITALCLGLPTAAEALPAYAPYKQYFFTLSEKRFVEYLNSWDQQINKVIAAQSEVIPRFQRKVISDQWIDLFNKI